MLELSPEAASAVTSSYVQHVRVESWLGDVLLADDVPVAAGSEEGDLGLRVPERVSLSVPLLDRGVSYDPTEPDSPLAAWGQQLKVSIGVELQAGTIEWLQRGMFLITRSDPAGDTVMVEAVGLLQLVDEARLVNPYQPTGTLVSTLRGLVEPALTVVVDAGLTDRAVPTAMNWDEDRLGGVFELLDAWPADAEVTAEGFLSVTPAAAGAPVLDLTDDAGGTVVRWQGQASRDGGYSVVVARGLAADGAQVQGTAFDRDPNSPLRFGGAFNPLPVPYFYFSPLLTTGAQCRAAAATILARLRRNAARKLSATIVPHPGLRARDVLSVTGAGLVDQPCTIDAYRLPLTADAGAQSLTLRVL